MVEVNQFLIESIPVFEKRQFDGGIDDIPSEEQEEAIDIFRLFSCGLGIDRQIDRELKGPDGLAPALPVSGIEFLKLDAQVFLAGRGLIIKNRLSIQFKKLDPG